MAVLIVPTLWIGSVAIISLQWLANPRSDWSLYPFVHRGLVLQILGHGSACHKTFVSISAATDLPYCVQLVASSQL